MFSLIGMGVFAAPVFSSVAVIVVLVLLGKILELRAWEQTGSAMRALLDLAAKCARLIRGDGTEVEVSLEKVQIGDRIAFARETRSLWTASSPRDGPRSTNRCSPVNPCRLKKS